MNKVIVWGYPLGSHTHGNVHDAFYRAFKYLGYEAYHVDDIPENREKFKDESRILYLTTGNGDNNIPLRDDCSYITHNCGPLRYQDKRHIKLQVLTSNTPDIDKMERMGKTTYYSEMGRIIFMPWATNLLPNEFDFEAPKREKEKTIYWVGTIDKKSEFENIKNLEAFMKACTESGIEFRHAWRDGHQISPEEHIELIRKSYFAPTIVGTWQHKVGFIPCRLFKNTSYGQLPVTNLRESKDIFGDLVIQDDDPHKLFYDAEGKTNDYDRIVQAMKIVQNEHTYVNRINDILKVL